MSIKDNVKNTDVWTRGLFILLFGAIYYVLFIVIVLVVLFQFFSRLLTTKSNEQLLNFSESLSVYVSQIVLYVTLKSDEKPFPFSQWPDKENKAPAAKKKVTKKKTKSTKQTEDESDDDSK